jgi:hypothetical protein
LTEEEERERRQVFQSLRIDSVESEEELTEISEESD